MSRRPRIVLISLAAVFVILVIARIVFGIWVTAKIRDALVDLGAETGSFGTSSISMFSPSMTVTDLRIVTRDKPDRQPVLHARVATADYHWGEVLSGKPVLRFSGTNVKFAIYSGGGAKADLDVSEIEDALDGGVPGVIDGLHIRDSEVLIVDLSGKKPKQIWIHGIDADLTGLSERGWKRADAKVYFNGHGTLQHSGDVVMNVEAINNVPAGTVDMSGTGKVQHFALADAFEYISEACGMSVQKGTVDLDVAFKSDLRKFHASLDTKYHGIDVVPATNGVINTLTAAALDVKLSIKSPDDNGHDFTGHATVNRTGEATDTYLDNLIDMFHDVFAKTIAGAFGAA